MKYFTVGPIQMHKDIIDLGGIQTPYFRNDEYSKTMFNIDGYLKSLLNMKPKDRNIYLTSSGTGGMEAAIINFFDYRDKLLVINGGSFGERFEKICDVHKIPYDSLRMPKNKAFSPDMLGDYEKNKYSALVVNIHETSTGQLYPIDVLSAFCKRKNMYFVVDGISSLFADEFDFTTYCVDVLIFSSQKALGLPPGATIISLSERMIKEKLKKNPPIFYNNFNDYLKNMERGQTPFTPAVGIYIQMEAALKKMYEMGYANVIKRVAENAKHFRRKLTENKFEYSNLPLSNAITPVYLHNARRYYEELVKKGFTVNPSGGDSADSLVRVSHLGDLHLKDFDELIEAMVEIKERLVL